jgi:TRAP-type C4-dicarboxylate transport system permease large subunit
MLIPPSIIMIVYGVRVSVPNCYHRGDPGLLLAVLFMGTAWSGACAVRRRTGHELKQKSSAPP